MKEKISSIMTTELVTVGPNDTLQTVKDLIYDKRVHHIPVVEGKKLVGILSTIDLWELNEPFDKYSSLYVKDIMTSKVGTLSPDDQIGSAAEIFLHNYFHTVPIVDENGDLVGLVSPLDIVRREHDMHYPAFKK